MNTAISNNSREKLALAVRIWLISGVILIFGQVVIGGITRLTGSGLSITKWEIVTGSLPPLNAAQWQHEFELYQQTPQYHKLNKGMSLSDFKFIYFWEFFHRLWARSIGLVFLLPFIFFWWKKMLPSWLIRRLGITVLLAAVVAAFGWIMVVSGFIDRPWVSAYRLTLHLSLALLTFGYLLWTTFMAYGTYQHVFNNSRWKKQAKWITLVICLQIIWGGLMSGMRAGLVFPTWPMLQNTWFPAILFDSAQWNIENVLHYDRNIFMPALVQVLHRNTAYILTVMVLYYFFTTWRAGVSGRLLQVNILLLTVLAIQILLGILTLINCQGKVPVGLGVFHQGWALVLLTVSMYLNFLYKEKKNK